MAEREGGGERISGDTVFTANGIDAISIRGYA